MKSLELRKSLKELKRKKERKLMKVLTKEEGVMHKNGIDNRIKKSQLKLKKLKLKKLKAINNLKLLNS